MGFIKKNKINFIFALLLIIEVIAGFYCRSDAFLLPYHFNKGERFLAAEKYDEAISEFTQAVKIDENCTEAYLEKLAACEAAGDQTKLENYYAELLKLAEKWCTSSESEAAEQKRDADPKRAAAETVFLKAGSVYTENKEKQLAILRQGLTLLPESDAVSKAYFEIGQALAADYVNEALLEEALGVYDALLDFADAEETAAIKEYRDKIELEWKELTAVSSCLTAIAKNCAAGDYAAVYELMQSADFDWAAKQIEAEGEIKGYETEYGRVGVYAADSENYGPYMVYVGEYEQENRSGEGHWFGCFDGSYYHAAGSWSSDKPNGQQTAREWEDNLTEAVVYRVVQGQVTDGLWDGPAIWYFEWNGGRNIFPVKFELGKWVVLEYVEELGLYRVCELGYGDSFNNGMLISEESVNRLQGIEGFSDGK